MNFAADGTYSQHTRATLRLALPNSDQHITYASAEFGSVRWDYLLAS